MHSQIGLYIQRLAEKNGTALSDDEIISEFRRRFIIEDGNVIIN
jgi:hypothetical protein